MQKFKPVGEYITIEKIKEDKKTQSFSLTARDEEKMIASRGRVIAVSSELDQHGVEPGDELYYKKGRSFYLMVNGERTLVVKYRDLIGFIR